MRKSTGSYPSLTVDTTAKRVIFHAEAMLLAATAGRVGLDRELSAELRPWMCPMAIHDPLRQLSNAVLVITRSAPGWITVMVAPVNPSR